MKNELTTKLNAYLANAGVEYIKLHNLHWNVTGSQFKAVHEYLETLYDAFADVLDKTAEALKMHGETPLASMKEYLAAATISELDSRDVDVKTALTTVLADLETLQAQAEAVRAEAAAEDVYDIVNLMEDDLGNYYKTLWFIRSMLK